MILLDTDILSLYHAGHDRVTERIKNVEPGEVIGTTIITRAEILRARFESLLKAADGTQLQQAQQRLNASESLLNDLSIAEVDGASADEFDKLCKRKKLKKIGRVDREHRIGERWNARHPKCETLPPSSKSEGRELGGLRHEAASHQRRFTRLDF